MQNIKNWAWVRPLFSRAEAKACFATLKREAVQCLCRAGKQRPTDQTERGRCFCLRLHSFPGVLQHNTPALSLKKQTTAQQLPVLGSSELNSPSNLGPPKVRQHTCSSHAPYSLLQGKCWHPQVRCKQHFCNTVKLLFLTVTTVKKKSH